MGCGSSPLEFVPLTCPTVTACTHCVYPLRVPSVCTNCVHQLRALTACTNCVHQLCVPTACTNCVYQLRVPTAHAPTACTNATVCTNCVRRALTACTNCLHQLRVPTACTSSVCTNCVYQLHAPTARPTARLAHLVYYSSRFEISLGCTGNYPLIIDRGNPSYLSHICSRVAGIKLVPDILAAYSCAGKRPFLATPLGRGTITLKYLADSQIREASFTPLTYMFVSTL